jgi:AcrR family transcriptional regulator
MGTFSERQSEIIDAAIHLIAEKGIQEMTIKNLADRVGISEPALYRHFENKTAILLGLLRFFTERSTAIFARIIREETPGKNQLIAVLRDQCRHLAANPAFSAVVFSEMIFQNEPKLASAVAGLMGTAQEKITEILSRGIETGSFRGDIPVMHLLITVMGSLRLLVTRWHMSNYGFDLPAEGISLAESLFTLLIAKGD